MIDLLSTFLPVAQETPQRALTLEIGTTFGPFKINFFASKARDVSGYSAAPTTDVLTATAHGLNNGDLVQVRALPGSALTDGLESGQLYFVVNKTTDTVKLSLTFGGSAVDIKNSDPGMLIKAGTPYNLTNHKVWAWVKHLTADDDNDIILNLDPTFTGSAYVPYDWQVQLTKTKEETFDLEPATHLWDLLLEFPDGTRKLIIEDTFIIKLPVTHPNLIS